MITGSQHPAYRAWLTMKGHRVPEWDDVDNYWEWLETHGYRFGDHRILRPDKTLPWGPDNIMLVELNLDPGREKGKDLLETEDFFRRWNRSVNRIRRFYHMPLFDEE